MKTNVSPVLITVALVCFALLPKTHAVSPAPDGGYPGGNTAEGTDALLNLTTGVWNTALGDRALSHDQTGVANTATGFQALFTNQTGSQNTAYGSQSLYTNYSGSFNTAIGYRALYSSTDSGGNTANGAYALESNTEGAGNTAIGYGALSQNEVGNGNTGIGYQALKSNTFEAGASTAIGYQALYKNVASSNTATGFQALFSNTGGGFNIANGEWALYQNTIGNGNVASGFEALYQNTTGTGNTADGNYSLLRNTTGSGNIALGVDAGDNLTTGNGNIDIGNEGVAGESDTIRIGDIIHTATFIAGISGVPVTGTAVVVNGSGQLGVAPSSARFKEAIKSMDNASEAILALKPVTFHYKKELDPDGIPQFGLVAEDVEKVNPDLIVRDKEGKPYSVRYEQVNSMLLNEFLKEHRKTEKLEATVAQQQKQIEALTAGLQKVSAQLEASKPAPQVVNNNQ